MVVTREPYGLLASHMVVTRQPYGSYDIERVKAAAHDFVVAKYDLGAWLKVTSQKYGKGSSQNLCSHSYTTRNT